MCVGVGVWVCVDACLCGCEFMRVDVLACVYTYSLIQNVLSCTHVYVCTYNHSHVCTYILYLFWIHVRRHCTHTQRLFPPSPEYGVRDEDMKDQELIDSLTATEKDKFLHADRDNNSFLDVNELKALLYPHHHDHMIEHMVDVSVQLSCVACTI